MGLIYHDGDPLLNLPVQPVGDLSIGFLSDPGHIFGQDQVIPVEVDIEVGGLEIPPLIAVILNDVLPELGRRSAQSDC